MFWRDVIFCYGSDFPFGIHPGMEITYIYILYVSGLIIGYILGIKLNIFWVG